MATYYWVGGTGNWSDATNHWSNATGGSPNAAYLPTSADDVIFDAGSSVGATPFTVTVDGTTGSPSLCANFSTGGAGGALAAAMTLSLSATAYLDLYGSLTLPAANFIWSGVSGSYLRTKGTGSYTLTTNGVTITATNIATQGGAASSWQLGSALTLTASLDWQQGSLTTNNYNISTAQFLLQVASVRTINLGSSTLTLSSATAFTYSGSGVTLNAGTSQINCSGATTTFAGGGLTFYNVAFTNTAIATITITGSNTFNNLSFAARAAAGLGQVALSVANTINGTLTLGSGTTGVARLLVRSATAGTAATLTVATLTAITDIDFRDITAAGASSPWSGTRIGNCLGNTNISFATPRTVYWNSAASASWSSAVWSTSSGNTGGTTTAIPLAQDTVIIDNAGLGTGNTITFNASYQIGTLDFSTRSLAMTFATGANQPNFYGDVTFSTAVTSTGTGQFIFNKQNSAATLTPAGLNFTQPFNQSAANGTLRLNGNLTLGSTLTYTLNNGNLDLTNNGAGNYSLTCGFFNTNVATTRAIAFGNAQINVTGSNGTVYNGGTPSTITYTGTPVVNATYTGSVGTRTINPNIITVAPYVSVNVTGGSDIVTFATSATYQDVNFTGFSGTYSSVGGVLYGNLTLDSNMTVAYSGGGFTCNAAGSTQTITSNGVLFDAGIVANGVGGTVQLNGPLSLGSARQFVLTNGTLNLNNNNLTCGLFSSTNSNTRTLAFGTGQLYLTGGGSGTTVIFNTTTFTGLTLTGTPILNATYNGAIGTRQIAPGNDTSGTIAFSVNVSAGSDIVNMSTAGRYVNVNFTGFSGTVSTIATNIYGNLICSPTMTFSSNASQLTFVGTSGVQQITTAGTSWDFPVYFSGIGGTYQLQDAMTVGPTRTVLLTYGTLNLNSKNLTCGFFSSNNSNTRTLAFGSGTMQINGSGTTAWDCTTATNLITSGRGTISMTAATAKTFAGGGGTFAATLDQGGAGALTISGANTFNDITASIAPTSAASILFTAGTTTTLINGFDVDGTAVNPITISSATAAPHTLSLSTGTVVADYLNLSYSTAIGGAAWYAGASTNGGNNTGWQFIVGTAVVNVGQGIAIGRGVVFS